MPLPSLPTVLLGFMLAVPTSAHFTILHPNSHIGVDEDHGGDQSVGPCSGFSQSSETPTADFYVEGDAIAVMDSHSQSDWLVRATLGAEINDTVEWQQLSPVWQSQGSGRSCRPIITAPSAWAGQRGVIALTGFASDGFLYACAAVQFTDGTAPDRGDCTNGTDIRLVFSENERLEELVEDNTPPSNSSGGGDDHSGHGGGEEEEEEGSDSSDDGSAAASLAQWSSAGLVLALAAALNYL